jgi:hypothetical protein
MSMVVNATGITAGIFETVYRFHLGGYRCPVGGFHEKAPRAHSAEGT